jgi:hypothetical protein
MRKLKSSAGNYLRNQTWKNLGKAALCLTVFSLVFFSIILKILLTFRVGFFEEAVLLVSLLPLVAFYYFLHRYRVYRGGWEGEKLVAKLLSATLSDEYYLINGVHFRGGGDIDHIILGPNGVFAVETKNWSGRITCNGDDWQRQGRRHVSGSPSRQAKNNAAKIKRTLDASATLRPLNIWVEAILVFTNSHTDLHTYNPTVPTLKLHQLPNYITTHKNHNRNRYTTHQLQQIADEIQKQTH